MSDNNTERVCDGCHDKKPEDVELRTFEMEYGGTETLCPDCTRQSHGLISGRARDHAAK